MRPAAGPEEAAVASTADDGFAEASVGYAFSEKKRSSLLTPEFISSARARGLRFVPVDPYRPLDEQPGHPYDAILHKLPSSSPHIREWEARLVAYKRANPAVCVVDMPQAARQLSNRATMLQAVEGIKLGEGIATTVAAPRQLVVQGDARAVAAAVEAAGLEYPLLAKPLMADGSELSHALALVHDEEGLTRLARGDVPGLLLPCVLQEFVDHGGSIFKVYVVGDAVSTTRRRSLPDQHAPRAALSAPQHSGLEVFERISTLGAHRREQQLLAEQQLRDGGVGVPAAVGPSSAAPQHMACSPPGYHIEGAASVQEPSAGFVRALALGLQAALGLQLFNFDLIRVAGARDRFLVVDINYFPGIAKMPGYEAVFADFLRRSVQERRAALRAQPEPGDAPQPPPLCSCGVD